MVLLHFYRSVYSPFQVVRKRTVASAMDDIVDTLEQQNEVRLTSVSVL